MQSAFLISYNVTRVRYDASLCCYLTVLCKTRPLSDEFEYSFDIRGENGDSSLHLHGVESVWLCPVVAKELHNDLTKDNIIDEFKVAFKEHALDKITEIGLRIVTKAVKKKMGLE